MVERRPEVRGNAPPTRKDTACKTLVISCVIESKALKAFGLFAAILENLIIGSCWTFCDILGAIQPLLLCYAQSKNTKRYQKCGPETRRLLAGGDPGGRDGPYDHRGNRNSESGAWQNARQ